MRRLHLSSLVLATALLSAAAGCATDDLADDQVAELDEELQVIAAGAPTLSLTGGVSCQGLIPHFSGHVTSSASSISLTFQISGGSHAIPHPGGEIEFNPGGHGTLVAKACNGSACTTRNKDVPWRNCAGGGGGGGGGGDPTDPR